MGDLQLKDEIAKQSEKLIDEHRVYLMFDIFNSLENELKRAFISMLDKWIDQNNFK